MKSSNDSAFQYWHRRLKKLQHISDPESGNEFVQLMVKDKKNKMTMDALSGSVFIFMNPRRTQIKLLLWEDDGFSMYYKRLEKGTFELPESHFQSTTMTLDAQQLQLILQGISLKKIIYRSRLQKTA